MRAARMGKGPDGSSCMEDAPRIAREEPLAGLSSEEAVSP